MQNAALPPEESGQDARDGTAAHEIGADLIRAAAVGRFLTWSDFEGKTAEDGTPYTEEMFEAAQLYAEDVGAVMRESGIFGGPNLLVETTLPAARIHEAAFGTSDAALYWPAHGRLYLWDFKFGHRYVDPFENMQGVFYFAALFDHFRIDGLSDQYLEVEFRIVQPRSYHRDGPIRVWRTTAAELRPMFNQLEAAAAEQFSADPQARTGSHCADCRARLSCAASLQAGAALYEVATSAQSFDLNPMALGLQAQIIKRALEHLTALDTAIDEQLFASIRGGKSVPGWGVEQTYGRAAWVCSVEDAIAVGAAFGKEIGKRGVMTPNQAIKAGVPKEIIDSLSVRNASGFKLVPEDGAKLARIFK